MVYLALIRMCINNIKERKIKRVSGFFAITSINAYTRKKFEEWR
jgi:hypothetical protein